MQKEKNLLKDLAAIRKKAGKVRDIDVLTDYAAAWRPMAKTIAESG